MRLKEKFLYQRTDSETTLVPAGGAGWSGAVMGNETLGVILDLLKKDTTEGAIIDAMKQRFDAPEGIITGDVRKALLELRKIGALDE